MNKIDCFAGLAFACLTLVIVFIALSFVDYGVPAGLASVPPWTTSPI